VENLSIPKSRLIKPLIAAVILVLLISGIAIYILPQYIYISPFSSFYGDGVVYYKTVRYGNDSSGSQLTTYLVSVTLLNDDPVNHFSGGNTNTYSVSKADWDVIAPGDGVNIKLLPNTHAQLVDQFPNPGGTPAWRTVPADLPLTLNVTSDKPQYAIGETANFTVRLTNDPTLSNGTSSNVSLSLFKDCIFYTFINGKIITSNDNLLQYGNPLDNKTVSLQPNQEINYSFSWNLTNIQPGTCFVRAYIGYYPRLQGQSTTLFKSITLTAIMMIDVTK
jgi:hypothetical protein